ncbi:surface protein Pls [Thecamonas trahens ATCC 50062]|uniref:Surface protein Pls n=1 Tax=Thecamonas trahens ATCC 50062 TaxID=461836 RepID=A0A0L0DEL9_THETB|nr:surface protein Pls [Thecamonas trahens ATCC 50062]KNC50576.1 surface protein Pls [Thecamonas trahens ATCC 50062]|eukprot:XP_013762466.1 surface protein Pls [Thecamonas trahens ATCC 50062]
MSQPLPVPAPAAASSSDSDSDSLSASLRLDDTKDKPPPESASHVSEKGGAAKEDDSSSAGGSSGSASDSASCTSSASEAVSDSASVSASDSAAVDVESDDLEMRREVADIVEGNEGVGDDVDGGDEAELDAGPETSPESAVEPEVDVKIGKELDDGSELGDEAELDAGPETSPEPAVEPEVDVKIGKELDDGSELGDKAELDAGPETSPEPAVEPEVDVKIGKELDDGSELGDEAELDAGPETSPEPAVEPEVDVKIGKELDDGSELGDEAELDAGPETSPEPAVEPEVDVKIGKELDDGSELGDEAELDAGPETSPEPAVEPEVDAGANATIADCAELAIEPGYDTKAEDEPSARTDSGAALDGASYADGGDSVLLIPADDGGETNSWATTDPDHSLADDPIDAAAAEHDHEHDYEHEHEHEPEPGSILERRQSLGLEHPTLKRPPGPFARHPPSLRYSLAADDIVLRIRAANLEADDDNNVCDVEPEPKPESEPGPEPEPEPDLVSLPSSTDAVAVSPTRPKPANAVASPEPTTPDVAALAVVAAVVDSPPPLLPAKASPVHLSESCPSSSPEPEPEPKPEPEPELEPESWQYSSSSSTPTASASASPSNPAPATASTSDSDDSYNSSSLPPSPPQLAPESEPDTAKAVAPPLPIAVEPPLDPLDAEIIELERQLFALPPAVVALDTRDDSVDPAAAIVSVEHTLPHRKEPLVVKVSRSIIRAREHVALSDSRQRPKFRARDDTSWVATSMHPFALRRHALPADSELGSVPRPIDMDVVTAPPRDPRPAYVEPTPSVEARFAAAAALESADPGAAAQGRAAGFATTFKASDFDALMPEPLPEVRNKKKFTVVKSDALLTPLRKALPPQHRPVSAAKDAIASPLAASPNSRRPASASPRTRTRRTGIKTYAAYGARSKADDPYIFLRTGLRKGSTLASARNTKPASGSPHGRYRRPQGARRRTPPRQGSAEPKASSISPLMHPPPALQRDALAVHISLKSLYAEPSRAPRQDTSPVPASAHASASPPRSTRGEVDKTVSPRHTNSRPSRPAGLFPGTDIEHLGPHTRRRRRHKFRRRRSRFVGGPSSPHSLTSEAFVDSHDFSSHCSSHSRSLLLASGLELPSELQSTASPYTRSRRTTRANGGDESATYSSTTTPTASDNDVELDSADSSLAPHGLALARHKVWTAHAVDAYVEQQAALPALIGHSICASDEFIIVFGGLDARQFPSKAPTNTVYVSPKAETRYCELTATGRPPCPRYNHVAVLVGRHMYVYGGMTTSPRGAEVATSRTMHRLDLASRKWSRVTTTGHAPPTGHTVLSGYTVDDKVFIMVGTRDDYDGPTPLFILDTRLHRWVQNECHCHECEAAMIRPALFTEATAL